MKWLKTFVGGILAGISIAIGGTVFLSLDNKVLGALFFTVGLFAVCTFGFNLYTGKVCYVFDNDREYALGLPVIWLGNLCGAFLTAAAERATRIGPHAQHLRVGGGILQLFPAVMIRPDYLIAAHQHRSDGNFALVQRLPCLRQRQLHSGHAALQTCQWCKAPLAVSLIQTK